MHRKDFPERGELVICTIMKAKGFGAFAKLEEYPGREGFIHIKEVASGWIKNIRDHVKENQRVVCKVMEVDPSKAHIDLSLKRVNDHQKREKIREWKNEQKAEKLFCLLAEEIDKSADKCYEEFGNELIDEYGSLYGAFEECAADPRAFKFEGKWVNEFIKMAKENIPPPLVKVTGFLKISSSAPNGIDIIKESLKKSERENGAKVKVEVRYVAAPLYRIEATARDYKVAERGLKESCERAIKFMKENGGKGEFIKELKK